MDSNFSFDVTLMDKLGFSTEKMEDNEFVNYSPMIFKSAREIAGIPEGSYMVGASPLRYSSERPHSSSCKAFIRTRVIVGKYPVWEIGIDEM